MIKIGLIVGCVALVIILVFWRADVRSDQANIVNITKTVNAYDDWRCGDAEHKQCHVMFEVMPGSEYQVQRIRYGKDLIAIKVSHYDTDGWLFYDDHVQLVAAESNQNLLKP